MHVPVVCLLFRAARPCATPLRLRACMRACCVPFESMLCRLHLHPEYRRRGLACERWDPRDVMAGWCHWSGQVQRSVLLHPGLAVTW